MAASDESQALESQTCSLVRFSGSLGTLALLSEPHTVARTKPKFKDSKLRYVERKKRASLIQARHLNTK